MFVDLCLVFHIDLPFYTLLYSKRNPYLAEIKQLDCCFYLFEKISSNQIVINSLVLYTRFYNIIHQHILILMSCRRLNIFSFLFFLLFLKSNSNSSQYMISNNSWIFTPSKLSIFYLVYGYFS